MDVESRGASSSRWRRSANRIAAALCFRKFDIWFGRDDTSVSMGARARRAGERSVTRPCAVRGAYGSLEIGSSAGV